VTPQFKSFIPGIAEWDAGADHRGQLTQTTAVSFNGVAASEFTVDSDKKVTVTVPPTQPRNNLDHHCGGTATSVKSFTVKD